MKTQTKIVDKKEQTQKPVKVFRAGSVKATIWSKVVKKDNKEFTFYTTTIERSYKDKEDNWKNTSSFEKDDLQKVAVVTRLAHEYLYIAQENTSDDTY